METLTDALEQKVYEYFRKLDEFGGMVRAIELGFPQREISEAAYRSQQKLEKKEDIIVGVNDFVTGETPLEILTIEPRVEQEQIARVQHLRQGRDNALLRQRLAVLESVAKSDENIMPAIVDAVRASAQSVKLLMSCGACGGHTRKRVSLCLRVQSSGGHLWCSA